VAVLSVPGGTFEEAQLTALSFFFQGGGNE